jgi:hypothetical protein
MRRRTFIARSTAAAGRAVSGFAFAQTGRTTPIKAAYAPRDV